MKNFRPFIGREEGPFPHQKQNSWLLKKTKKLVAENTVISCSRTVNEEQIRYPYSANRTLIKYDNHPLAESKT